jgi:uncharacterized OsmC-like protein
VTINAIQERIGAAFERMVTVLTRRPDVGAQTAVTCARIVEGLTCEVTEGPWTMTVDMAEAHGGGNAGPTPGVLGRGALGSCMAIGYMLWASRRSVPIESLEVEVHADYDAGNEFGTQGGRPAYSRVHCVVRVNSSASEERVRAVLKEADAHGTYLDLFTNGTVVQKEIILQRTR